MPRSPPRLARRVRLHTRCVALRKRSAILIASSYILLLGLQLLLNIAHDERLKLLFLHVILVNVYIDVDIAVVYEDWLWGFTLFFTLSSLDCGLGAGVATKGGLVHYLLHVG